MKNEIKKVNIIHPTDTVKIKKIGNEIEIHSLTACNKCPIVKRLCKGKHINTITGEIINDKIIEHRGEAMTSLRASNIKLADIIKANALDINHILLLTLTYREKQFDVKKIQRDFKTFIKHLRLHTTRFGQIEYVSVRELYADQCNYHIHALLFFNQSQYDVFISADIIEKLWKHGTISIGQAHNTAQVYHYLTPHIANAITTENKHMHEKALLQMKLPAGQRLFNCSQNIIRPQVYKDSYTNASQHLQDSGFNLIGKTMHPSHIKTYSGNILYHVKEYYKQEKPRRKPI